jgi:oligopeptide/dipeptide ABC transporter ATP-binding protein
VTVETGRVAERSDALVSVTALTKEFASGSSWRKQRPIYAVRAVDITIEHGQTLGLVGESGSGKSTVGRLLAGLVAPTSGDIEIDGIRVSNLAKHDVMRLRRTVQVIPQDPLRSLNPRMTVEQLVEEPFRLHRIGDGPHRARAIVQALDEVGLGRSALKRYPHEFSGGQRQRIAIARALALKPKLIIADEPTSALDVVVQANVLNLMKDLQSLHEVAYLFISHDLHVVEFMSDVMGVMYLGEIVETGGSKDMFESPKHPYTEGLLSAVPSLTRAEPSGATMLRGEIPSPTDIPQGCGFRSRCPKAMDVCASDSPTVRRDGASSVRCHLYDR